MTMGSSALRIKVPLGAKCFEHFGFGIHDTFQGTETFQVGGTDVGNQTDIRRTDLTQSTNFTATIHSQFQNGPRMAAVDSQERQWNAHQVVEVAKRRQGVESTVDDIRDHGTRGCLAVGSGQGDHGKIRSKPVKRCKISEGCQGYLSRRHR